MPKYGTFDRMALFFGMVSTLPLELLNLNVNGAIRDRYASALQGILTVKVSCDINFNS